MRLYTARFIFVLSVFPFCFYFVLDLVAWMIILLAAYFHPVFAFDLLVAIVVFGSGVIVIAIVLFMSRRLIRLIQRIKVLVNRLILDTL